MEAVGPYNTLKLETRGEVNILSLNRADRLNALSYEMIEELSHYFTVAGKGGISARVIVMRGEGRAFCAGMDLSPAQALTPAEALQRNLKTQYGLSSIVLAMRSCPQPIIGLIHGAAAGGGFALSLACDVRLATSAAKWVPSFVHIGLSACDCGISYFLPRLVGRSIASELLMAGRTLKAERAERIGLISEIVDESHLLQAGLDLAAEMLRASPLGLRMTKDVLNLNEDATSLEAAVALENRTQILCGQTDDLKEGVAAFLEKRPAQYRGL